MGKILKTFLLAFLLPSLASAESRAVTRNKPALPPPDLTTQYWLEAFEFFQSEGDSTSLELLRTKALEKQSANLLVMKKALDSLILLKDRSLVNENFIAIAQRNSCIPNPSSPAAPSSPMCRELKNLWVGNLDSLFFFEESAGKLEKARRFLESKECDKALSLLKEVELREGSFVSQAELSRRAFECLGDDGNRVAKESELKKLKIFDNY
jgi:hypothetical protein